MSFAPTRSTGSYIPDALQRNSATPGRNPTISTNLRSLSTSLDSSRTTFRPHPSVFFKVTGSTGDFTRSLLRRANRSAQNVRAGTAYYQTVPLTVPITLSAPSCTPNDEGSVHPAGKRVRADGLDHLMSPRWICFLESLLSRHPRRGRGRTACRNEEHAVTATATQPWRMLHKLADRCVW